MKLRKLYVALIPLKLRELILPLFSTDIYSFFQDREAFKLIKTKKKEFKRYFSNLKVSAINQEFVDAICFMKKYGWTMHSGDYSLKYRKMGVHVYRDSECGLLYVIHHGKRLYFMRSIIRKEICAQLYKHLLMDQDLDCPHHYIDSEFIIKKDSVLFDIGAAEGMFTLTNIEHIKHAYLFECDKEWEEALIYTFKPWQDRITIINKFVSDIDSEKEITIDSFVFNNNIFPNFIKMDIEGSEQKALIGTKRTLSVDYELNLAVCTYHRQNDATEISKLLRHFNYQISFTKGHMLILDKIFSKDLQPPYFRKGVIRASRTTI